MYKNTEKQMLIHKVHTKVYGPNRTGALNLKPIINH